MNIESFLAALHPTSLITACSRSKITTKKVLESKTNPRVKEKSMSLFNFSQVFCLHPPENPWIYQVSCKTILLFHVKRFKFQHEKWKAGWFEVNDEILMWTPGSVSSDKNIFCSICEKSTKQQVIWEFNYTWISKWMNHGADCLIEANTPEPSLQ